MKFILIFIVFKLQILCILILLTFNNQRKHTHTQHKKKIHKQQ